jgi:peptidoglycan-N-acetylglucosamine deacetylase
MSITGFWPDGYQAAATVTVNFDAESVEQRTMPNQPLWGRMAFGRYGAQAGVQRILDTLQSYGIRATFFIPSWDAERYPDVMRRIQDAGHEVAGRGHAYEDFSELSAGEQDGVLARGEAIFEQVFGRRPVGWRAPDGLMTNDTRTILARRDYLYDSSFCDDDVPYLVPGEGVAPLVELPFFPQASDRPYYSVRRSPDIVKSALRQELSAVYQAGGLFNLALRPRGDYGSGRGVRIRAVEAIVQELVEYPRLWVATCEEIATWRRELRDA